MSKPRITVRKIPNAHGYRADLEYGRTRWSGPLRFILLDAVQDAERAKKVFSEAKIEIEVNNEQKTDGN